MYFLDQFQLDQIINTILNHVFYDLSNMNLRKLYSLPFIYFIFVFYYLFFFFFLTFDKILT